jgi:hypothetical protein
MPTELPTREEIAKALGEHLLMDVGSAMEDEDLPPINQLEKADGCFLYFSGVKDEVDEDGEQVRREWGFTLAVVDVSYG